MKKYNRIFSLLFALAVIIGSISFSGIAFGEEDDENIIIEDTLDSDTGVEEIDEEVEDDDEKADKLPESKNEESIDLLQQDLSNDLLELQDNPKDGSLKIHKSVSGNAGFDHNEEFTFTLTGPNGYNENLTLVKKDNTGNVVTFENLPYGEYYLTEALNTTKYKSYYISDKQDGDDLGSNVNINSPNIQRWVMNNVKEDQPAPETGTVKVIKQISDDIPQIALMSTPQLEGFRFELHQGGERKYEPVLTNSDGEAIFGGVLLGEYNVVEILTSEQKETYLEPYDGYVNVSEKDTVFSVHFTNYKKDTPPVWRGRIEVEKRVIGSRSSNPSLAGFSFHLYEVIEGEEIFVETITTNESGLISFNNLEEGLFKLYEDNRALYIRGIGSAGREISLNPNTAPDKVIVTVVTNERFYPNPDPEDPEDPEEPDEPDDDDDDDDNPPTPRPRTPDDDDDDDVLDEVIVLEPTPEAQPEPVVEEVEEVEEIEEVEDQTPQAAPVATLPKTGSVSPFINSGFGAILLGLGLFLKKKD